MIISPWSAATWTRFTRSPLWRTRRIAWVFKPLHCLSFAIYSALLYDDKKAPRADKHSFDGTGGISLLLFARDNKTKQLSYSLGGSFCLSDFCISRALKSTAESDFSTSEDFCRISNLSVAWSLPANWGIRFFLASCCQEQSNRLKTSFE